MTKQQDLTESWGNLDLLGKHFRYFSINFRGLQYFQSILERAAIFSIHFREGCKQWEWFQSNLPPWSVCPDIFKKGKERCCKYCYGMWQYFLEKNGKILQILLSILVNINCVSQYFLERKGRILQIVLSILANIKCVSQYFLERKGRILQILLLILANIKCMPQYF